MFRLSKLKAKQIALGALKAFRRLCIQSPARAEELRSDMVELTEKIDSGRGYSKVARKMRRTLIGFKFKSPMRRFAEWILGLAFALAAAVVIRQMWFELFQVPTGSMRPTIREGDNLVMTKDAFGINIPLSRGHFSFNEKDLRRLNVTLFTGMGLPIQNNSTIYFWLFPGIKQYVKRCMAKGGDQLYFYGGKIYGLDKAGHPLGLESSPIINHLDHVPLLSMHGDVRAMRTAKGSVQLVGYQMNEPLYRAEVYGDRFVDAEVFIDGKWQRPKGDEYREQWGLGNYARTRMIRSKTGLALELFTQPRLTQQAWKIYNIQGASLPQLTPVRSEIPLEQRHLDALMDGLYTSRFVVKDNRASPYDYQGRESKFAPKLPISVPNGTYEFYGGKLFEVSWLGSKHLTEHPLLTRSPEMIETLFNMGISFNTASSLPGSIDNLPMRYAYFREGALYVMGSEVFAKGDALLSNFVEEQKARAVREGSASAFAPFVDPGPPTAEMIQKYGLKVPKDHALMLGDNHANSGDSRMFGFVPYKNIRGYAEAAFWPPRSVGRIAQTPIDPTTPTRLIVWSVALISIGGFCALRRYRVNRQYQALKELISNVKVV